MKTSFFHFVLCLIVSCLFYITSNQTVAAPLPSAEDFCEVVDYKLDNRNYARSLTADLNVGEPRTVRMIYFLPNDRPYRADVVQRMKDEILNIQTFYAEAMQAHGYQDMTFKIETDSQGEPVVHRVDGQHPLNYYDGLTSGLIFKELSQVFDFYANIFFIVREDTINEENTISFGAVGGVGTSLSKSGGYTLLPSSFRWKAAAHELGHAFGLQHDFRSGGYIMSYGAGRNRADVLGPDQDRLSTCNADFLAVHPYFNPDIPTERGQLSTIEMTSPSTYPTDSESVDIQLKVTDSDGIHQVILFVKTVGPSFLTPVGFLEVKACHKLTGEKEAVVEFEYDGDIPSSMFTNLMYPSTHHIGVATIDTDGDVTYGYFTLSEILYEQLTPKTLVKISGDNQQGSSGTTLINPLVVEVRDWRGNPLSDVIVKFAVISGSGRLGKRFTSQMRTTDARGQAESTFTLGANPGDNIVDVSVRTSVRSHESVRFHAIGVGATTISRMNGIYQTWGVPDGIRLRLGKGGVGESENAVIFSPDGQYLAVSSNIGIWLYDATTYQEIALLPHLDEISALAFSPDGNLIAGIVSNYGSVNSDTINLWDMTTKQKIATFGHGRNAIEFSPNGKTIASGYFSSVYLWDVATGKVITKFSHEKYKHVNSISFSSDGTLLASGGRENVVRLWDVKTGQNINTFQHKSEVYSVVFSPDGKTLASASGDRTVKFWDVATGKEIFTIRSRTPVVDITFSPNGRVFAFSSDGIKLWEVETGQNITTFDSGGNSIDFSPDGNNVVSASGIAGVVEVWDIQAGSSIELEHMTFRAVSLSPDRKTIAAGTYIGTIQLWDVETGQNIGNLIDERWHSVKMLRFSPDGRIIASRSTNERFIRLWDVSTQKIIAKLEHSSVYALTFSPTGKTLTSGDTDGIVKLWDVATRQNIATLEAHTSEIRSLAFSPDGNMLASGAVDGTIKLWDVETGQNIVILDGHIGKYGVKSVMFLPDGKTLVSREFVLSPPELVKLWDLQTQTLITTFEITSAICDVSTVYSSDGTMILKNFHGIFSLLDAKTLTMIATFEGFCSNERTYISTDSGVILLEDIEAINRIVNTTADFFLSVKEGSSLIHIPLKVSTVDGIPKTIETIGDLYDVLGGPRNVKSLSTRDYSHSWHWHTYSNNFDRGTLVDKRLTDYMGILAQMRSAVTIALQGDALGTNGRSTITLQGPEAKDPKVVSIYQNVIGIPLRDPRIQKVSDLFSLDGFRDNIMYITVEDNGIYQEVRGIDDPNDMPITGGQAFYVYVQEEATVDIYGEKWTNERSAEAAPSVVTANVEAINRIETSLLPNYPNPFNPETWIPYRLAEDADVTLIIYDVGGRMVRTLNIGHSKAGIYKSRDKAIYWDGRNDLGEGVASGVYFYHLTAGEYSATKRLVILK